MTALYRLGAQFLAPGIEAAGKLAGICQPSETLYERRHCERIHAILSGCLGLT